jgi:hypothetical protein
MQSKGLLSLIMMVTIGTMSVSARHTLDLDDTDHAMEEPAHVMDAAAEQEFSDKAMASSKHAPVSENSNNTYIRCMHVLCIQIA